MEASMRSRTTPVRRSRESDLRRVCLAALALVVLALLAGVPQRPVQAQSPGTVNIRFALDSLPIALTSDGKPILCQGEQYRILVQGILNPYGNEAPRVFDELINVTRGLNPI